MSDLKEYDISHEMWREYDWIDLDNRNHVYKILNPVTLYLRPGGTTHRVVNSKGIAHCVPGIGLLGCVLRWQNYPGDKPVRF